MFLYSYIILKLYVRLTSSGADTSSLLVLAVIMPASSSLQFLMISFRFLPSEIIWILKRDTGIGYTWIKWLSTNDIDYIDLIIRPLKRDEFLKFPAYEGTNQEPT